MAEENAFLKAAQRNGGKFDPDDFQRMREISGVSLFEADLDLKPDTVYRAVQYRWLPGLLFRRCMIDFPWINRTSWLDDGRLRGLGLIASVSALITVRMLNAAQNAGLLDRMSFGELMARLRLVRRMEEHGSSGKVPDAGDGRWSVPDKSSMEILARLGLAGGKEADRRRENRHQGSNSADLICRLGDAAISSSASASRIVAEQVGAPGAFDAADSNPRADAREAEEYGIEGSASYPDRNVPPAGEIEIV